MPTKSHTISNNKTFHSYVQNHFNKQIKTIRSNNDTEFINTSLTDFFQTHGIGHQTTCPNKPQQNARVERKYKHLLEVAISIKFQRHFHIHLWGYFLLTATYIINRLPPKSTKNHPIKSIKNFHQIITLEIFRLQSLCPSPY